MLLGELIRLLRELTALIETIQKQPDYIGKDEVEQYLRWACKHLADEIWQTITYKNYGPNGNAWNAI